MSEQDTQKTIQVEVVLAMPERQELVSLEMTVGSTLAEAVDQSALADSFEGFEVDLTRVGIFGQKASPDQILRDGDRVEVYRPLIADPKEGRRQRAIKQAETKLS